MADTITENRILLGVDTITPLVLTDYVYSYSSGVEPMTNNQVRILVDSSNVEKVRIFLPPISSFSGNYDVTVIVVDLNSGRGGGISILASADSSDTINGSSGDRGITVGRSGFLSLTIGCEGKWFGNAL
jgi:hypothetical protein